MDLLCMVGIGFCFAVVQSLYAVIYYSDYRIILRSIKYVSRVNFDSTYPKIKVENTILRFLPLKYSTT